MSSAAPQFPGRAPLPQRAPARRPRLQVVPRGRTRAAKVPFVTLIGALLLGGVVALLLFNTSMQQASFAATDLEQQAAGLNAREQALKMEVEGMRDPQRLAVSAQKMGMVPATCTAFLDVKSGKVSGEPCAARPGGGVRLNPSLPKKPKALDPRPIVVPGTTSRAPAQASPQRHTPDVPRGPAGRR